MSILNLFKIFKSNNRLHPNVDFKKNIDINSIISHLSIGNVLLQNSQYTTKEDVSKIKKETFSYFSK